MIARAPIWAVVPVKETSAAKQRLSCVLPAETRRALALAMLEDVLDALTAAQGLAGLLLVTEDEAAAQLGNTYGATSTQAGARDGHTGAVTAAARSLAARGAAMLTVPGDIPLVRPTEIEHVITAHHRAPGFTIVPARDELGSNAILMAPADAVPLRFGENSFFPHLAAARAYGLSPNVVPLAGIGLDIDAPDDLAAFLKVPSRTRARAVLDRCAVETAPMPSGAPR
jgi:2-phospho-L-lactate/phosphoenolpyruvate guanylyltransferase